jgi:hypothetical protein
MLDDGWLNGWIISRKMQFWLKIGAAIKALYYIILLLFTQSS